MKKKAKKKTREDSVRFKASADEKAAYEQAGIDTDLGMSGWIRRTLNQEVERLRKQAEE